MIEFERKTIRFDPRSRATTPSTLWSHSTARNMLSNEIFAFDTKGDPNNAVFNALYGSDIPQYRLFEGFSHDPRLMRVLRRSSHLQRNRNRPNGPRLLYDRGSGFLRFPSDDVEERIAHSNRYFKIRQRRVAKPVIPLDSLTLKSSSSSVAQEAGRDEVDFISLDIPRTQGPKFELQLAHDIPGAALESVSASEHMHQHWIEQHQQHEAEQVMEKEEEKEESFEDYLLRRTREFNEQTRARPHDVDLWMRFVRFQDELVRMQKRRNTTAIIEKKEAIFERALQHNPRNAVLVSAYLNLLQELKSSHEIDIIWQEKLSLIPDNAQLWTEYIVFKKASHFADFSTSGMRPVYVKAIQSLMVLKGRISANDVMNTSRIEQDMLRMFFDAANFEMQSGYTERAIAMFQALIEINIFCPMSFITWDQQFISFEDFWESEAPRFGEKDARGWNDWLMNLDISLDSESVEESTSNNDQRDQLDLYTSDIGEFNDDDDDGDLSDNEGEDLLDMITEKQVFMDWLREEEKCNAVQWHPCRPMRDADTATVYPDRIVLFDDVKDYLFPISSSHLQYLLVLLFLEILGVSIAYTQASTNDVFVHESMSNKHDSRHLFSIFRTRDTRDKFDWKPMTPVTNVNKRRFIINVFTQALDVYSDDSTLTMGLLDFEKQRGIEHAQRLAKSMLKKDSQNLLLWNYYIQTVNDDHEAVRIYETTLVTVDTNHVGEASVSLMVRCFVERLLRLEQLNRALNVLCIYAEFLDGKERFSFPNDTNTTVPSIRMIRSARIFENRFTWIMQHVDNISANLEFLMCHALFLHLTKGTHEACRLFDQLLMPSLSTTQLRWPECPNKHFVFSEEARSEMQPSHKTTTKSHSVGHVFEQYLWLLYLRYICLQANVTSSATIPKYVYFDQRKYRHVLQTFLERFPGHPVGLSLLMELESSFGISSRMRRMLGSMLQRSPSPVLFILAIYSELDKRDSEHKVRSLFERAMDHQGCRSNVMLWRMYMRVESSPRGSNNPEIARRLFFRAINRCPHSKALWMDNFRLFYSITEVAEMRDMYDLMTAKEVHIRRPIDEIIASKI